MPLPTTLPASVDVLVVGAGVIGLAHAVRAHDAGLRVLVIDRDHVPSGASVRNFGHIGSSLQSGDLGVLAHDAHDAWVRLGERTGIEVRQVGTVVVAANDIEHGVLEEVSDTTGARLLTATECESMTTVTGHRGAFFPTDLRVDPRTTVPRLAAWLAERPGVDIAWNTSYLGPQDDASVRTSRGVVRADRTIVCVGHDLDHLAPDVAAQHEVQRCRLQMARVDAELPVIEPAVLTATSMLRYSAFADAPSFTALRADAQRRLANLLDIDANLMMTQLPDGTLVVGDSHEYALAAPPFLTERTTDLLVDAASQLLSRPLRVVERWQGVYATSQLAPILVRDLTPTTTAVTVTTGLGMTLSHGLAARTTL